MKISEWEQKGKHLNFKGYPIFFIKQDAEKEVLLCLHGFPTSSFDYHKIWGQLSERFSLIAYDMIGYGFSEKPADLNYTTFLQADLLEELVSFLKVEKLHILSHDYGNTIIQELLARREEGHLNFEIASIFMMNGALFPETHRPILAQKILISPVGFLFNRLATENRLKKSLASVFGKETQPTNAELDDFLGIIKSGGGKKITHKLIRYMSERAVYRDRWVGALKRFEGKFRLMIGMDDPVSGAHLLKRFREVMPDKEFIEIPGVGHFPHFEVPDTALRHFFDFHTD
ncbi:MAG: alpha/beta hydrolase [Pyrinomonadaceae bacterium]